MHILISIVKAYSKRLLLLAYFSFGYNLVASFVPKYQNFQLWGGLSHAAMISAWSSSRMLLNASDRNGDIVTQSNDVTTIELFSLESIRSTLVRQEETIIFALIERAQYRRNYNIYDPKKNKFRNVYGAPLSFLEWMLLETEKLHSKVRRYTSPEEHPFFEPFLPPPLLSELNYPQLLAVRKSDVDVNNEVMRWYVEKIVDRLCVNGDDEQYGSSVLCDIAALQAISKRVHYGKFVAESKFLKNPALYTKLIEEGDVIGILNNLTNKEVERAVIHRAYHKASTYGQDITGTTEGFKVQPMLIADIYRDMIIPLTKDVEVRYLFLRLGKTPPPPDTYYEYCRGPPISESDILSDNFSKTNKNVTK
eukprot:gene5595-7723_t